AQGDNPPTNSACRQRTPASRGCRRPSSSEKTGLLRPFGDKNNKRQAFRLLRDLSPAPPYINQWLRPLTNGIASIASECQIAIIVQCRLSNVVPLQRFDKAFNVLLRRNICPRFQVGDCVTSKANFFERLQEQFHFGVVGAESILDLSQRFPAVVKLCHMEYAFTAKIPGKTECQCGNTSNNGLPTAGSSCSGDG